MTDPARARHCGNCGTEVSHEAITCPACDALLAAYEPPAGATTGTGAAVDPVPVATVSMAPPPPAPSPVAPGTQPARASEPPASPVAQAMEATIAAVEASPQPTTEAERRAVAAIERPVPDPRPEPPRRIPRPQPAAPPQEPPAPATPSRQPETRSRLVPLADTIVAVVGVLAILVIAGQFLRGAIFIPLGVVVVIWVMSRVAKQSGRKTTSMPRDRTR